MPLYVDLALATGTNSGASWTNAYQGPAGLVSALAAASAGEVIYVKGQKTGHAANVALNCANGTALNPVRVIGVKPATSAEPPTSSDLIPGLWSGGASPAYEHADVPTITQTNVSFSLTIDGQVQFWGMYFASGTNLTIANSVARRHSGTMFEECHLESNLGAGSGARPVVFGNAGSNMSVSNLTLESCRIRVGDSDDYVQFNANLDLHNCVIDSRTTYRSAGTLAFGTISSSANHSYAIRLFGCDLSALGTSPIFDVTGNQGQSILYCCRLASSYVLTGGTKTHNLWSITNIGSQSNPSLSSTDSLRQLEIETANGTIAEDTSIVRTGGANDGGSGQYTWAMTPVVNGTRDNYLALASPWMVANVNAGSQTLTVYIANSGSGDYQNDEVWLEVFSPAESTSAVRLAHRTIRCDLLATPANITDDTSSDWGTGAGGRNAQKLEVTISPAYRGQVFARVLFSKNFSSSPETLYVDPRIYGAATPTKGTMPLGLFGGFMGSPDPAGGAVFFAGGRSSSLLRR